MKNLTSKLSGKANELGTSLKRSELKNVSGGSGLAVVCMYTDESAQGPIEVACRGYETNYTTCPNPSVCPSDVGLSYTNVWVSCNSTGNTNC
ncbi:MAG: hypothetical protein QM528_08385 [Phycisphaerales bacterium]|nr:hypothetical protein [Phycisphaerales bacterium]